MAKRNIMGSKPLEETVIEKSLNIFQACNEFCLTGTTRMHILRKFKDQENTKTDWKRIFRGERVI